ncbi:MAG: hypothetical protein CVV52_07095 [Spirochaetae bacterium HGW-Spirochaetae-8]|nr:MAG: hypothetical protein CVV52_07095 [Spirochaetae bacterium HGW-Spirochaetae-8]
MQAHAADGVEPSDSHDDIEIGDFLLIHDLLDIRFEKEFHARDPNHLLEVFVDAVRLGKEILVEIVHHGGGGFLKGVVKKQGKQDHRRHSGDDEE